MQEMKKGDSTIYPQMSIAQLNVGKLEIGTMAYSVDDTDQPVRFCHWIDIRDAGQLTENADGWGKLIFSGSLEELIALVREASLVKES